MWLGCVRLSKSKQDQHFNVLFTNEQMEVLGGPYGEEPVHKTVPRTLWSRNILEEPSTAWTERKFADIASNLKILSNNATFELESAFNPYRAVCNYSAFTCFPWN